MLYSTDHVLREVDSGSPAERAGMQDGEILLEVNGESVDSLRHDEIVERVRLSGKQVFITTISQSGLGFYNQVRISYLILDRVWKSSAIPKLPIQISCNFSN